MRLPMLPVGQYRAFEADSDFLFPGAWLVGQFVRNWFDITDFGGWRDYLASQVSSTRPL